MIFVMFISELHFSISNHFLSVKLFQECVSMFWAPKTFDGWSEEKSADLFIFYIIAVRCFVIVHTKPSIRFNFQILTLWFQTIYDIIYCLPYKCHASYLNTFLSIFSGMESSVYQTSQHEAPGRRLRATPQGLLTLKKINVRNPSPEKYPCQNPWILFFYHF